MKKILFFLVSFFLFSHCFCQWQPINGKQRFTNGLGIPTKDTPTTSAADTSMITIRPQDGFLWVKTSLGWYCLPKNTTFNGNAILNGGNTFGNAINIGSNDNQNLNFLIHGSKLITLDTTGLLKYTGDTWHIDETGSAYFSTSINTGAIYPFYYLGLPDTSHNSTYNQIGSHAGNFYFQPYNGYFRQVLTVKDSNLYVTFANLSQYPTFTSVNTSLALKQNNLTLTTTGTSGSATLSGSILNIPTYTYTLPATVTLNTDTIPLASFGVGSGQSTDTAAFQTTSLYGSFYHSGSDTLVVTSLQIGLQGTSPNINVTVLYGSSLNSGGTEFISGGTACTNTTTGTSAGSLSVKIPPNNWVWCKSNSITTQPTYLSTTLIGYKKHQ